MTSKHDPKWTDETLPVQKRKQLLAQELARLRQREAARHRPPPGDRKPEEKSDKPVAGVLDALRRQARAMA